MDKDIVFFGREARKLVVIKTARLMIVATRMTPNEWSLRVENERGVRSEWFEQFSSAEDAIKIAQKAIRDEGVEEFVNIEGFDYLDEPCTIPWKLLSRPGE